MAGYISAKMAKHVAFSQDLNFAERDEIKSINHKHKTKCVQCPLQVINTSKRHSRCYHPVAVFDGCTVQSAVT